MRIVPKELFLDGRDRFKPGRIYEVTAQRAQYFIQYGWARPAEAKEYRWYRRVSKLG